MCAISMATVGLWSQRAKADEPSTRPSATDAAATEPVSGGGDIDQL
jgi:hypothetical protein